jgi:hypothetical protein
MAASVLPRGHAILPAPLRSSNAGSTAAIESSSGCSVLAHVGDLARAPRKCVVARAGVLTKEIRVRGARELLANEARDGVRVRFEAAVGMDVLSVAAARRERAHDEDGAMALERIALGAHERYAANRGERLDALDARAE